MWNFASRLEAKAPKIEADGESSLGIEESVSCLEHIAKLKYILGHWDLKDLEANSKQEEILQNWECLSYEEKLQWAEAIVINPKVKHNKYKLRNARKSNLIKQEFDTRLDHANDLKTERKRTPSKLKSKKDLTLKNEKKDPKKVATKSPKKQIKAYPKLVKTNRSKSGKKDGLRSDKFLCSLDDEDDSKFQQKIPLEKEDKDEESFSCDEEKSYKRGPYFIVDNATRKNAYDEAKKYGIEAISKKYKIKKKSLKRWLSIGPEKRKGGGRKPAEGDESLYHFAIDYVKENSELPTGKQMRFEATKYGMKGSKGWLAKFFGRYLTKLEDMLPKKKRLLIAKTRRDSSLKVKKEAETIESEKSGEDVPVKKRKLNAKTTKDSSIKVKKESEVIESDNSDDDNFMIIKPVDLPSRPRGRPRKPNNILSNIQSANPYSDDNDVIFVKQEEGEKLERRQTRFNKMKEAINTKKCRDFIDLTKTEKKLNM